MNLLRGDIVLGVLAGDFGKPQPVLVVQNDLLNNNHSTILVCPITSYLTGAETLRLAIEPSAVKCLRLISYYDLY